MSWFNVWDGLKNKTCRYLLQRYLGQFLEEKLNLEQLKIELYHGKATIKNVSLKIEALNELCEAQGWAVEVIDGHIGELNVTVPWNALMSKDSSIEISNLVITLRPIKRQNTGTSMLESMWSSASSSIQMAEECMKQKDDTTDAFVEMNQNSIVGLEKFAETIDNVLNRINAKFINTVLRLEYPSNNGTTAIALTLIIEEILYKNETGCDKNYTDSSEPNDESESNSSDFSGTIHTLPSFAKHKLKVNGLRLHTEEFNIRESSRNSSKAVSEINECREGSPDNNDFQSYMYNNTDFKGIPILEIRGEQNIEIKMKQSEDVRGPKVYLDVELGSIYTFLMPRQIHLILKMLNAFSEDGLKRSFDRNAMSDENKKSMNETLNSFGEQTSNMAGILGNRASWDNEYDDNTSLHYLSENSFCRNVGVQSSRYCDSLTSSVSSTSTVTNTNRLNRKFANMETSGEILNFSVRISSIIGLFLHEDILVENNMNLSSSPLQKSSVIDALKEAECFFSHIKYIPSEVEDNSTILQCDKNHLYLRTSPVFVNGTQQRNKTILLLKVSLTAATLDLAEVLEKRMAPLISFDRDERNSVGFQNKPELTIQFKSTFSCNFKEVANTSVDVILQRCTLDFDISIYDRLSGVLGPSPYTQYSNETINMHAECHKRNKQDLSTRSTNNINVVSSELNIKLRFPIVDTRSVNDPNRIPWWKQNIRSDFILIAISKPSFKLASNSMEVIANEINVFYCEKDIATKIHILNASSCTKTEVLSSEHTVCQPKISIDFHVKEEYKTSVYSADENKYGRMNEKYKEKTKMNLPFSSRRECRQSDTVHLIHETQDEGESVLLPGEKAEIDIFCDSTMKTSNLSVKINLPIAKACFESKCLYEVIYNRFNSDILMWEPTSPLFKKKDIATSKMFRSDNLMDSMYIPSSTAQDPYESYEEKNCNTQTPCASGNDKNKIDINTTESIYFSAHESNENLTKKVDVREKQSDCSVQVVIGEGSLTLFVPVRDIASHVLPGQLGKFDFRVKCLKIFSVNGFNNNANLGYVCLYLKDIEVYHCGQVPVDTPSGMEMVYMDVEDYMQSTFYETPKGLTKGNGSGIKEREMMSLVIEIKKMPEQRIKRLKITTGIQRTTLRHNPAQSPYTWLNQLIDFLDVVDYPIEGYQPYGVITEIQIKLWDCAIDYRPTNLEYRAVVEIGSFTISSNIISSVVGCNLRFVLEECALSIAPFDCFKKEYRQPHITFISSANLVPVVDIGLFDISLRLNDGTSSKCPKMDLRCSIYDFHLRTCYDSGSALCQLITHISTDGDSIFENDKEEIGEKLDSSVYSDADIFSSNESSVCSELVQKQQERVNLLMAEAVQETITTKNTYDKDNTNFPTDNQGIEVFYFPDENSKPRTESAGDEGLQVKNEFCDILNFESNVMMNSYYAKSSSGDALPQVKADLGDVYNNIETDVEQILNEEDYCIIFDNNKSDMNQCGIKNVKIPDDPLRIVDNHFCLPTGKPDLLKSPDNFPIPLCRYTLCEMTFTWHLYGGNDFPENILSTDVKNNVKSEKPQMSEAYRHGVAYSTTSCGIQFGKKPKDKLTWKTIGGPNRNHEILVEMQFSKVRFSHEEYPLHTSHASRQVLLISDIEIRDRLQTSDINKFLYYPNSKKLLNKNSRHMLVIKALHVRPNPKQCAAKECSLRISVLPLRLNIDQDTLVFLADFFLNLGENCNSTKSSSENDLRIQKSGTQHMEAPIMTVDETPEAVHDLHARKLVATNLGLLMDEGNEENFESTTINESMQTKEQSTPIYFREVIFSPELPICFDYQGRHVEFSRGPIVGLLMGLGQLECSEIRLRKIEHRRGILGFEKLIKYVCNEWLKDIKRNQLSKILKGVGPTKAFKQLFDGIYDLFRLPFEQYQKDGRIIRGIQLGAQSFTARTALAALEITARIIQILQFTAETAFDMVSPGPSVRKSRRLKGKKKRTHRPKDIREGVTNAYMIVKEGINDSANNLIETAVSEHDQKGYTGAVGAVMRQIPQLVVCPAVLATQATTNILGGVKSSLVPEAKLEAREKWKNDSD